MPSLESSRGVDWERVSLALILSLASAALGLTARGQRRRRLAAEAERQDLAQEMDDLKKSVYYPVSGLPESIDQFAVLKQLGQGGMATVFLVRQPDGSSGALKLPAQQLAADPEFRKRFDLEMTVGARLHHPGLVRIDHVNHQEPPYYVMEALEGHTLAELSKPVPLARVRELLVQILETLGYLHEKGVIHRDLKPSNIMLTPDGRVKLMDFGLVLLTDDERTRLTASGQILGTPAFMAPEQMSEGSVDARTDLYAVGLIAYELLAGTLPFPEDMLQLVSFNPSDAPRASSCLPIWPNCGVGSTLAVLICSEQTPLLRALPPCIWTIWDGNPSARDASDGFKLTGELPRIEQFCPEIGRPWGDWIERLVSRQADRRYLDSGQALLSLPA